VFDDAHRDIAREGRHAILQGFQLARDIHAVRLHKGLPSRFAIVTRHGGPIRWFEAEPTYVLHWLNAYEDGDEIILDGYFQEDPTPRPPREAPTGYEHMMAFLDDYSFKPKLHRWRFNLKDGSTTEAHLDDRIMEFGMFNQRFAGREYRYVYSTVTLPGWFLFNGFVKTDLETGTSTQYHLPEGRYASEAPFAPRIGAADPQFLPIHVDAHDALQAGGLFDHAHFMTLGTQTVDQLCRDPALFQLGRPVAAAEVRQTNRLLHVQIPIQHPDQHFADVVDDCRSARRAGR